MLLKKIRFASTVSTIVLISTLTLLGFITFNFTVIQLNSPSFDLIVNCTRGTVNFSSDGTQRTMIFQTSLNNNRSSSDRCVPFLRLSMIECSESILTSIDVFVVINILSNRSKWTFVFYQVFKLILQSAIYYLFTQVCDRSPLLMQ